MKITALGQSLVAVLYAMAGIAIVACERGIRVKKLNVKQVGIDADNQWTGTIRLCLSDCHQGQLDIAFLTTGGEMAPALFSEPSVRLDIGDHCSCAKGDDFALVRSADMRSYLFRDLIRQEIEALFAKQRKALGKLTDRLGNGTVRGETVKRIIRDNLVRQVVPATKDWLTAYQIAAYAVAARRHDLSIISLDLSTPSWWGVVGMKIERPEYMDLLGLMVGVWARQHADNLNPTYEARDWCAVEDVSDDEITEIVYGMTAYLYQDEDERDLEAAARVKEAYGYTAFCLLDQNRAAICEVAHMIMEDAIDTLTDINACVDEAIRAAMDETRKGA